MPYVAVRVCLVILCLTFTGCQAAPDRFLPADGDLLFQDQDAGALCDAIETVTEGCDGAKFSHVGMAAWEGPRCTVIEAGGGGVKVTPLERFLSRSSDERGRPKVVVGRLRPEYQRAIAPALVRARALVGSPYDGEFLLNNGKYYCSELVYESYLDPRSGEHLFKVEPMTFCPPGSDQPMKTWVEYFAGKKMPIPEGKPGCNPGGISRSDKIAILHAFGKPTGWTEAVYRRHCESAGKTVLTSP